MELPSRHVLAVAGLGLALLTLASFQAGPQVRSLRGLTPEEEEILGHLRIVHLPDGRGGTAKTLEVSGVNVRIVNGLGATNGNPADPAAIDPLRTTTNGLGNLIVGYNELRGSTFDDRTGSHNIVFGAGSSFSSFGGLVGARSNLVSFPFATVSGGEGNTASGLAASVTGGRFGRATGPWAAVSGGKDNAASGSYASVGGGVYNAATYTAASVSGGFANTAGGAAASVSGGSLNVASGWRSSVGGGRMNESYGPVSSVSGGALNRADDMYASVAGGRSNRASGWYASISGGKERTTFGTYDWRAGSLFEEE